ncbi:MAG TPA: hypothetical protein VG498_13215 [Terriglobales bacterium]|nr:hypothetical protein [Terriglobales bacterium]
MQSGTSWNGERGFIDRAMLAKHLSSFSGPIYYLAGPPAMVAAMRQMLAAAGPNEDDVRTEEFAGYDRNSENGFQEWECPPRSTKASSVSHQRETLRIDRLHNSASRSESVYPIT